MKKYGARYSHALLVQSNYNMVELTREHWQHCGGQLELKDWYVDAYLGDDNVLAEFQLTFPHSGITFLELK